MSDEKDRPISERIMDRLPAILAVIFISAFVFVILADLWWPVIRGDVDAPRPTPAPMVETLGPPQVTVVVDGLLGPIGMAPLPDGGLLVAEEGTGSNDLSAGVSLIQADGAVGRLISGLESGRDAGDLSGVPLVALSPDGKTVYLGNFNQRHLWTLPLSQEQQKALTLPATPYTPADLTPAMQALNNVWVINPYDLTFDAAGIPVVTDASGNGVATMNPDGTTRFIHRFDAIPNPIKEGTTVQAVPTGIERVGDEYYVTLTGGCPYPVGAGQLVAIDDARGQRTVLDGLNMPIDVAQGPDGTIWLLEFARFTTDASCFDGSGYQVKTGRLSRILADGTVETVLTELNFPGAILPMPDGSLYITEVFPGRVLHVTFGPGQTSATAPDLPRIDVLTPVAITGGTTGTVQPGADSPHTALRAVADRLGLQPNPGEMVREGDTPLAKLGQDLFFDPLLSGDRNISCATCHHPDFAMADGRTLPIGTGGSGLGPERVFVDRVVLGDEAGALRRLPGKIDPITGETVVTNPFVGQFVPRNSPTVINSALFPAQFWDGRVQSYALQGAKVETQESVINDLGMTDVLAAQALFPLTSLHEMAGATLGGLPPQTIRTQLLARLQAEYGYLVQFLDLFGDQLQDDAAPEDVITLPNVALALAAFERRFIFTDAPWDDFLAGDDQALSDQQVRGALLFFGEAKDGVNCTQCHSGDLFTDMGFHNLLAPQLGPGKGNGYTGREDWGRAGVTFDIRDRYKFRTPSLRNVALTAPYFHDGAYATLASAITHHCNIVDGATAYDPSANGVPPTFYSSLQPFQPDKQWASAAQQLQKGLPLDEQDIADLVAFLEALTDPAATDLDEFVPESVPSNLPLDQSQAAMRATGRE